MLSYLKKGFAVLLALVFVLALLPTAALAADEIVDENTFANPIPFTVGQSVTIGGGPVESNGPIYYNVDKKYVITITQPSVVDVTLSTVATTSTQRVNSMRVDLYHKDNTSSPIDSNKLDGVYSARYGISVYSNEAPLTRKITYKLMPGTFYLRADCMSACNALATISLAATPMIPDALGEPNDNALQAKPISLNTTYQGNIRYEGAPNRYGKLDVDEYDYYKLALPSGAKSLKLTASRADAGRQNHIDFFLSDVGGSSKGGKADLTYDTSGSVTYTDVPAGTYYILVSAWGGGCYGTEYEFRVDGPPAQAVKAKSVKLNKTSLSLKKGKKVALTATVSPKNTTDKTLKWTSSKPKIASVTQKGVVKGLKKGSATIMVKTINGKKAACKVQVK